MLTHRQLHIADICIDISELEFVRLDSENVNENQQRIAVVIGGGVPLTYYIPYAPK